MKENTEYRVIYVVFKGNVDTGKGVCFAVTNKRVLSIETGIGYSNLVRVFTRERRSYYWFGDFLVVRSEILFKQRMLRGVSNINNLKTY